MTHKVLQSQYLDDNGKFSFLNNFLLNGLCTNYSWYRVVVLVDVRC